MTDMNRLLRLRQSMKRKRPKFLHQEHWKLKRFKKAPWRKPRGKRSKMRSKERAKPYLVSIGYRGPKKVRDYHPKGVPEIIVHNVQDVDKIPATEKIKKSKPKGKRKGKKPTQKEKPQYEYVVKIASGVGTRKKIDMMKAAAEKNLYIANPAINHVNLTSVKDLESLVSIKDYVKTWYISDKVPEEKREEIEDRAQELGIEVMS